MASTLTCIAKLPPGFRKDDILAFHRRDAQAIAERVDATSLHKGLLWHGVPACLSIRFTPRQARAQLALDGPAADDSQVQFEDMVGRMLGLSQDVAGFEGQFAAHPLVGALIRQQTGLRVPLAATPFEALSWAITGQQISVAAAVSIRRRLIHATGLQHSSGLLCHPGPETIAALDANTLRNAGFSSGKADTLLKLSALVASNELPFQDWLQTMSVDDMRDRLLAIRGIGPWTINYTLLRGFGWLDGSLHGDVAVRRAIETLQGASTRLDEKQARVWLEAFAPWRALLAAHLWASRSNTAY